MIVKTHAIVLRTRNLRETSKFLTLYTESFGKLTVVAKGVRQIKSRLAGILEPFNIISVVLYKKENRDVHYISSAEIVEPMWRLTTNFDALTTTFAVAELTDVTMHGEEKNPLMFTLLADTFRQLALHENTYPMTFLLFQLRLITLLGYGLDIASCIICGKKLAGESNVYFHIPEGGLSCGECEMRLEKGTKLSSFAYQCLITLKNVSGDVPDPLIGENEREIAELHGVLNAYIIHHSQSKRVLRSGAMMCVS